MLASWVLADTAGRQHQKKLRIPGGDNYSEDDSSLFLLYSVEWPVTQLQKDQICGADAIESKLTRRPFESLIFCASVYPYPGAGDEKADEHGAQYLNLNVSLP